MKSLIFIPFIILTSLMHENAYARSLQATADKLGQGLSKIAISLGVAGFALAAIYMILGKQNSMEKATQVAIGVFIAYGATAFIQFTAGIA